MEIEYSESLIDKAKAMLEEMVQKNISESPFGDPFPNFSVVIGETQKKIVAIIDVPEQLKQSVDKAYIVTA